MKHYLLTTLLLLAVTLGTKAATYEYLVFETSDGTQLSMTAEGLKLIYSDGMLTATNSSSIQTFPTNALTRMFFSNTKQGDDATAIHSVSDGSSVLDGSSVVDGSAVDTNETEVYDLSGRRVHSPLRPGLYIFKRGNTTTKKYVK